MKLFAKKKVTTFEDIKAEASARYAEWRGNPKDAIERLNRDAYIIGYAEAFGRYGRGQ